MKLTDCRVAPTEVQDPPLHKSPMKIPPPRPELLVAEPAVLPISSVSCMSDIGSSAYQQCIMTLFESLSGSTQHNVAALRSTKRICRS